MYSPLKYGLSKAIQFFLSKVFKFRMVTTFTLNYRYIVIIFNFNCALFKTKRKPAYFFYFSNYLKSVLRIAGTFFLSYTKH